MRVLGIETSCDETGLAVYDEKQGLLGHTLFSQVKMHQEYGGVVPELASRDHIQRLYPLLDELLDKTDIKLETIDAIAYTKGPGLIGALLVGATFAKALAFALKIPALGVHHMEGHLLAPMLEDKKPEFPFLALLVSGGHTMLAHVSKFGKYEILGQSLDDAAGEAFDKTAKLLNLGYPGGPNLAKIAENGNPHKFTFPRPLAHKPTLDFSFSGLKTFALNTIQKTELTEQNIADIAYAFEDAVTDSLIIKCKKALLQTNTKSLVIAGGVSANKKLRAKLHKLEDEMNIKVFYPKLEFCTDNGAMIAYAGFLRLKNGEIDSSLEVDVKPRWDMEEL